MPKRKTNVIESFGGRLAQLRKAAGYTQVEFAAEIGITQRMVAYYEAPGAQPPAHLFRRWLRPWASVPTCYSA